MNILKLPLYEIAWYGLPLWCCFIAIAFCSTRYLRWVGLLASPFVVALLVIILDVHWIFDEMKNHPENGRDFDFIFIFGVMCRIVFFNFLLLPVSVLGLLMASRRPRGLHDEPKVA